MKLSCSGWPSSTRPKRRRCASPTGSRAPASTAWEAAGTIHTEIQEAFVKAEAIGWNKLVECGGYAPARGLLRVEGRDYVVQDGDVITIKV